MIQTTHSVAVSRDDFGFSAGQLIVVDDVLEPFGGHSYQMSAEVFGSLSTDGFVCNFATIKHALRRIVAQLNHKTLIPTLAPTMSVTKTNTVYRIACGAASIELPESHCLELPLVNGTTELLGDYILRRFLEYFDVDNFPNVTSVRVGLSENVGQWCYATWNRERLST